MKNWLGAVGRSIAAFCIILLILAATAAIFRDAEASFRLPLLTTLLGSLTSVLPCAAAAAIFLGFFIFEERSRSRLLSWASLFALGCLFLAGGVGLKALRLEPSSAPLSSAPVAGRTVEAGTLLCYVRSYDGGEAVEAVGYDFQSRLPPRLTFAPRTAAPGRDGIIAVEGNRYPLRAKKTGNMREPSPLGPSSADIAARLIALDGLRFTDLLIAAAGFILLATGLASLSRLPRWPLVGFFLSCAGLYLLIILDIAIASPELSSPIRLLAARVGFGSWPAPRIEAAIEGGLGLLAGLAGLLAPRRGEA